MQSSRVWIPKRSVYIKVKKQEDEVEECVDEEFIDLEKRIRVSRLRRQRHGWKMKCKGAWRRGRRRARLVRRIRWAWSHIAGFLKSSGEGISHLLSGNYMIMNLATPLTSSAYWPPSSFNFSGSSSYDNEQPLPMYMLYCL